MARRWAVLALLMSSFLKVSLASDRSDVTTQLLLHIQYSDQGAGRDVTEQYAADEHRRMLHKLEANQLTPEKIGTMAPECDMPITLAMEFWATHGSVDWKVMKKI